MKKVLLAFLLAILLVSLLGPWSAARADSSPAVKVLPAGQPKIDPALGKELATLQQGETVTVIVTLRQQVDLSRVAGSQRAARRRALLRALRSTTDNTQRKLKSLLNVRLAQGTVKSFTPLWVFNGFSVTTTSSVINELAQQPDVLSITSDDLQIVPALGPAEPNIAVVNAPALWGLGDLGQGVVVANMDSGVDLNHPDLAGQWRGGSNSWYDPYGQHPSLPTDVSGHGTQTMGVMVGGDAGGTTVGIAPEAQWIAVKILNDSGGSTATAIHLGFQWLLDPDNNPATDDAPDVVNNSWTYANPGCNLDFEPDFQALRAADILPIFAAGNGGPLSNSSFSPANNPSAFAVGAINNNSQIYGYSSRGPSTCGGSTGPYPELVAPGVNIRTTDLLGGYKIVSGTSLASPHVAGALALLLSAHPNLSAAEQQNLLINSAFDLGAAGADNVYGYGRLNILAAFNLLGSAPTSTPLPTNTGAPSSTLAEAPSSTPGALPSSTLVPSSTSSLLPTFTPTPLPTNTWTPSPTFTYAPSNTPTGLPTSTSVPTKTATPSPTFTATISASALHSSDLDRSSTMSGTKWNALVTILIHNNLELPVSAATVTGKWTNGATGTVTCTTNANGTCTVTKTGLRLTTTSVTFTVTNVTKSPMVYQSSANHDPDGESNGTTIVVSKP
jgi:subtilisin family serine protease